MEPPIAQFLRDNGLFNSSLKRLQGGANNSVYLVENGAQKWVLKHFFHETRENKSRLELEYNFLTYAAHQNITSVCKPVAFCKKNNLALLSFLSGRTATVSDITENSVHQFARFLGELNPAHALSASLQKGVEACFCYNDYLLTIEKKLHNLQASSEKTSFLSHFLEKELIPHWENAKRSFFEKFTSEELHRPFFQEDLCITPSDMGFHNVLVEETGKLNFIDFEYAGWDDLAKTFCDFFCQPRIPVPFIYFTYLKEALLSYQPKWENALLRAEKLLPICRIKWCCIILNVFASKGNKRRAFSGCKEQKLQQLELAKNYLNTTKEQFLCKW